MRIDLLPTGGVLLVAAGTAVEGAVSGVNPLIAGQVLTFLGVVVTTVFSYLSNRRAKSADAKATVIHALVNSEFQKAQRQIAAALKEVAELKLTVAKLTGTADDAVKAVVAEALATAPPTKDKA